MDFDRAWMWKEMPPGMDMQPVRADVRERLRQKLADKATAAADKATAAAVKAKSDVDEASASFVFIKTKF